MFGHLAKQIVKMLFVAFVFIILPPRGAPPSLHTKYKQAINESNKTFHCFDGKKSIELSRLNDNFVDCADGSDEPGTSAFPGGSFYCANNGSKPDFISKWKVDDGVCDCCDCSDEIDDHIKVDTCESNEKKRNQLIRKFENAYKSGMGLYNDYKSDGEVRYKTLLYKKAKMQHKLDTLEKIKERIVNHEPYKDLGDPDNFVSLEDYVPPQNQPDDENPEVEFDEETLFNSNDYDDYDYEYEYYERYKYGGMDPQDYRNDYQHDYISDEQRYDLTNNDDNNNYHYENNDYEYHNENNDEYDYHDENNNENNYNHFQYNSDDDTDNSKKSYEDDYINNDSQTKGLLGKLKGYMQILWNYTFLFPNEDSLIEAFWKTDEHNDNTYYHHNYGYEDDNDYHNAYDPYRNYDPVTSRKIIDIDNDMTNLRSELISYQGFDSIGLIDTALFHIYMKKFSLNKAELTFLKSISLEYHELGTFKKIYMNSLYYTDGSYCTRPQSQKPSYVMTKLELQCWNEDKFIRLIKEDDCKYLGIFATPAACTKDSLDKLQNMTLSELERLDDIMSLDPK